jgi:hypothetical protein
MPKRDVVKKSRNLLPAVARAFAKDMKAGGTII